MLYFGNFHIFCIVFIIKSGNLIWR
jgi:hypothetical protein